MSKLLNGFLMILIFSFLVTREAKAYLDPGSSSYLLQILFAGFFSVLLAVKTFWKRIVFVFKQIFGRKATELRDEKSAGK